MNEEYVDSIAIDGSVDMTNAVVDDAGDVIRYHDPSTGKTQIRSGSSQDSRSEEERNKSKAPEAGAADGTKTDTDANAGGNPEPGKDKPAGAQGDDKNGADENEGPEENYHNAAHFILASNGYGKDTVVTARGEVKIQDLTPEEQFDVIADEHEARVQSLLEAIEEAKNGVQEYTFDDPAAQQVYDLLKTGADIKQIAKEILTQDPAAMSEMLSDEEVVKLRIQKDHPKFSKEEVQEEFKEFSKEKVARWAKSYREELKTSAPDLSRMTEAQKEQAKQRALIADAEHIKAVNNIKNTIKATPDFAGVKLSEEAKQFIEQQLVPKTAEEHNEFVKKLQGNDKQLVRLQILDSYFDQILQIKEEAAFKKGLAQGQSGKERLADEPIRQFKSAGKSSSAGSSVVQGKPGAGAAKSIMDMSKEEMDQFLSNNGEF